MKKGIIKSLVLIMVFCVGIIVFGQMTNHTNEDLTTEMADATLPVISLYMKSAQESGWQEINELHGYTMEMEAVYMRDSITPVNKERILPIEIQTYDAEIEGISYEIRSMNMDRLIADAQVEEYDETKGLIQAKLAIQNLLDENEEYILIIELQTKKNPIYYYTRIMEEENCYTDEAVSFVLDFHEKTFDKNEAVQLSTYLEPNASGDNSTLHHVDIHSTLNQVAWADFKGERLTTPVPSFKEINSSYTVLVLNYLMSSANINGAMEYYNVEEYFRVRHTADRMYLLNYERTMNEIFRAESAEFYENYIQLGIRDTDVEFATNEKGNIICFVQEGELWSYNETTHQLVQVYSFIGNEGIDARENYGEHDIKIINISETGSINFVVYGYMNSGIHEGQVGICVYNYDSASNTIEEELFIPSKESYQVMKADLGQMMYENTQGIFFIMLEGTVYRIDLSNMKVTEYITGLKEGTYAISESHKFFAWMEGENIYRANTIKVVNLDTGNEQTITAGVGESLKVLGFMEDDFVYGIAKNADILEDLAGNTTFPMYQVRIVEPDSLEKLKTYEKNGYYVEDVQIEDYIMYLNRIAYNGMAYVDAAQDTIMNREGDSGTIVGVHTTITEEKETQVQLTMADVVPEGSPKILTPKEVVLEQNKEIALSAPVTEKRYYAYARGKVLRATDDLTDAISVANDEMGVVIGDEQQYIWKRAKKTIQNSLEVAAGSEDVGGTSIAQCISAMLERESVNIGVTMLISQGKTPKEILETTMENVIALDLTGCTLEEVLYYVNLETPIFAMTSDVEAVLVVGYDAHNVILFNPVTNTKEKMGLNDATEMFHNAGNVFFGYMPQKN